ncbi:MAG: STAS/SEC14 domain-containing protein [Raineya sp.]|jgi:hypothetical protein|nr:STAS/SEC14 domain-containing protein [Raineya sp.]
MIHSENLYSNDCSNISYISEINTLYLEFIGKIDSDEYKEAYGKLLEFIVSKNIDAVIADQTKSQGSTMDSRAWLVVKWLPEVKKQIGDKRILLAGISEAKFGFKKVISQYVEQTFKKMTALPVESFSNIDDAIKWIKASKS